MIRKGQQVDGQMDLFGRNSVIHDMDIRGLMDDAYCPECGYLFDEYKELDCPTCPECGLLVKWDRWHKKNDEYFKGGILSEKAQKGPLQDGGQRT